MNTYLLLRNNKKSGPYSLDQLISFGLKPYDLVWVEGKSAAWRYPSEVDVLKEYAPSVEEQPFDRFYKKPNEEKATVKLSQKQEQVLDIPAEVKPAIATRKVFVSMPEGQLIQRQAHSVQPAPAKTQTVTLEKVEERKPAPVKIPVVIEEILEEKKSMEAKPEPVLNEKYAESLDDIKRKYAEVYLTRKKNAKWASHLKPILQVVGGAIFFCLLVVAAYKNFSEDDSTQKKSRTTFIQPKVTNTSNNTNPLATIPATTKIVIDQPKTQQVTNREIRIPGGKQIKNATAHQNELTRKEEKEIAIAETKQERKAVMPPPSTEIKAEERRPKPHPVNIANLVNVKANNYKQRAFGGVLNLQLTVNNESKFALDKVIVELQYLKPSEQPLKIDKIVFNNVAPGGSQTLKIPDYLRGIKVVYKIIEIESAQYHSYTAGL